MFFHVTGHAMRWFALTAILLALPSTVMSQDVGVVRSSAITHAPYLTDVSTFDLTANHSKRVYQISVALPHGYDPSYGPYPVVYAADANVSFGIVVESLRLMGTTGVVPQVVVVGIGYDNPGPGFAASFAPRALDLTPTSSPSDLLGLQAVAKGAGIPEPTATGGASEFLSFLQGELVPYIESHYRVSRQDRAWFGHSYGGIFGVYAMLHAPRLFQRYVLGSPSLDFDHDVLLKAEDQFHGKHKELPAVVYLAVGGDEELVDDPMVSDLVRFVAQVQSHQYAGLKIEYEIFSGESHPSVLPLSVIKGFQAVYKQPLDKP